METERPQLQRRYHWLIAILCFVVAAVACSPAANVPATPGSQANPPSGSTAAASPAANAATPKAPSDTNTTLVYAAGSEPAGLDPQVVLSGQELRIVQNVYETLGKHSTGNDQVQPDIVPSLAESWTRSDDGLTYMFKLRKGVKFHDGSDFNADAVKFNFDRMLALNRGPATFFGDVDSVTVVDPLTVAVKLKRVNIFFEQYLPFTFMISPTAVQKNAQGDDRATKWLTNHAVGTGPYQVESWAQGQQTVLTAFADYWGGWQGSHLKKIIVQLVPDAATQKLMLANGDAQMIDSAVGSDVADLSKQTGVKLVKSKGLRVDVMAMNQNYAPLADENVRKAIVSAFPYPDVIRVAYTGLGIPAIGPLSKDLPGSAIGALTAPHQDLKAAQDFLSKSKYPNGGFSLRFVYSTNLTEQKTTGLLLADALKPLNITVDVQTTSFAQMIDSFAKYNEGTSPHLAMLRLSPVTADPVLVLRQLYYSKNAGGLYNWSYYRNDQTDKLLDQAQAEPDKSKRDKLLEQVQTMAVNSAAYATPLEVVELDAMRSNLTGFKFNPYNYSWDVYFYDMSLQ